MLNGEKVVLRAWSESDLFALQSMRNELQLQRLLMACPRGNSLEQVRDWLSMWSKSQDKIFFVVACQSSGEAVGYVQVSALDLLNGVGSLGICIELGSQGKGYGREAIALFEKYLHDILRLRKIMLEVLAANEPAICLYKKIGYKQVGQLSEHFFIDNRFVDVIIMEKMIS